MRFTLSAHDEPVRESYVHWRCGVPFLASPEGQRWLYQIRAMLANGATITYQ